MPSETGGWGAWLAFGDAAGRYLFLNWLFQATCLLGAGLLLSRLPRLRPSVRHALLAAALFLAVLAPAARLLPSRPATTPGPRSNLQIAIGNSQFAMTPIANWQMQIGKCRLPSVSNAGWLLLLGWTVTAGTRLAVLAGGHRTVGRWLRCAAPVERGRVYDACGYGIGDIPVLETERVSVPCVAGLIRPCILLPRGIAAALELHELRHVLLHEEAHARRRDPLVFFLAELAHAMLFWHPLAGLARGRLEATAEEACDVQVLAREANPPAYARTLLAVLERAALPATQGAACPLGGSVAAAAGRDLRRRVLRILNGAPRGSPFVATLAGSALLAAAGSAVLGELGRRPVLPALLPVPKADTAGANHGPAETQSGGSDRSDRSDPSGSRRATPPLLHREPERVAAGLAGVAPVRLPAARLSPSASVPVIFPEALPVPGDEREPEAQEARDLAPREGRCVVFVLDNSSSMRPYQAEARRQVMTLARRLGPGHRFNVVAFSSDLTQFAEMPVTPCDSSFSGVEDWLAQLPEGHGTNLTGAVSAALAMPDVTSVVLVSDQEGSPAGAAWPQVLALVRRENRSGAGLMTLTFGTAEPSGGGALRTAVMERRGSELDARQRPDEKLEP